MGAADLIPGISGGTIALITGIYKNLLDSIDSLNYKNLSLIKNGDLKMFWEKINGNFLITVFSGIILSILIFSYLIDWLIENRPIQLWSFFFGVLITSIFFLKKLVNNWNLFSLAFLVFGILISYLLTTFPLKDNDTTLLYLFFCGIAGSIAMILPGISGAYIFLILGVYHTLLNSIKMATKVWSSFKWEIFYETFLILSVTAIGFLIGLRFFASILKKLIEKNNDKTMSILIGLMIGSIQKIWPWQEVVNVNFNNENLFYSKAILPYNYNGNPEILTSLIVMITAILLTIFLGSKNLTHNK